MAKKLSSADRVMLMLSLVAYLNSHGATPVSELADHFEVDKHLIRKLAAFLGTAGIPGEMLTYQHEDLFDIDWDALIDHDVVSLTHLVAVDHTPRFSSAETAAIIAGAQSLREVLPVEWHEHIESVLHKLAQLDASTGSQSPAVSVHTERENQVIATLSEALSDQVQVRFSYQNAKGELIERVVDPQFLTQTAHSWYLQGYCHSRKEVRHFLIDRIRSLTKTTEPTSASVADKATAFSFSDSEITATVKYRTSVRRLIGPFQPEILETVGEEWVIAQVRLSHPQSAIRIVQSAPGEVEVVGPQQARAAVQGWTQRALEAYASSLPQTTET